MTPSRRRKKRSPLFFVATCPAGLESLVADEVRTFGGQEITHSAGAVRWQSATLESGYRACLWSRFASRILLQLHRFHAPDAEAIYPAVSQIDWADHFTSAETFAVSCTLSNDRLTNSHYLALRVKDAIVDQFRNLGARRPAVDTLAPDIRIHLHIADSRASLSLDLSGESLHRRGYRAAGGAAPLKENLAAGLVALAGINPNMDPCLSIFDPMCGSATLLIESALLIGDSAPGLQRRSFGFMKWRRHSAPLWEKLVNEALEREQRGLEKKWPQLIGSDADPAMVRTARKNVAAAGLSDRIVIKECQLAHIQPPSPQGLVLTNPPYGKRLLEKQSVRFLYRCLGRILRQRFNGWSLALFSSHPDLVSAVGVCWEKKYHLFNGPIPCCLLTGPIPPEKNEKRPGWSLSSPPTTGGEGDDLANRLYKNCTRLFKWARKRHIYCFRVYDADIPAYNFSVDLYESWVHVQEYAPPGSVDPETAQHRFRTGLQVIGNTLGVPRGRIFIKTRRRKKGKQQYQKQGEYGRLFVVREGGAFFLVNLTDYLDTGLFLDHRQTRQMIGQLAEGKRFLNLFGYTGTATVYAALGGAQTTTTVDLSRTYLDWARANLALNGLGGSNHRLIQADCVGWLQTCRQRFDLIFVDPPTFSSSRHRGLSFAVQKDHQELLVLAMKRLTPDGLLIFSNNYRRFKLSTNLQHRFVVREITGQTLPRDFRRSRNRHRCWQITHRQNPGNGHQ